MLRVKRWERGLRADRDGIELAAVGAIAVGRSCLGIKIRGPFKRFMVESDLLKGDEESAERTRGGRSSLGRFLQLCKEQQSSII